MAAKDEDTADQATAEPDSGINPSEAVALRVESNYPARVWINDYFVGKTPWERKVLPGRKRIELIGEVQGKQFTKVVSREIKAGKPHVESIIIKRVKVQVSGQPADTKVLALDNQPIDSQFLVNTFEGWHTVKLLQIPTGTTSSVQCQAKVGAKDCKIVLRP